MYNSEDIKKMLETNGLEILPTIIDKIIQEHEPTASKMQGYYQRYTGEKVPIYNRRSPDKAGIAMNNKIHIDYEGIIIDQIKGYVWGHPIKINYKSESEQESKRVNDIIDNLRITNNLDSLDEETGELSSICGYAGRLVYFDTNGNLKIMNTNPWETIFIVNNSTNLVDYGLIYYDWDLVDSETGNVRKTTKVEWYDNENVYYYIKDGGKFQPDETLPFQKHFFNFTPLVKFKANNLEQSDLEKVIPLIDAQDILISDAQNEIMEFVHAYLTTTGAELTKEERIKLRSSGVINLPDKDAKIDFLTKNINGEFFEKQKETLRNEIFNVSKTVDMSDEKFTSGGIESGESRKWKLLSLEFKAITKERKFTEGLREMWRVITSSPKQEFKFDYKNIEFTFIRNLPIDFLYYADIATKLQGIIPKEDILAQLPFVKNVNDTLKKLEAESDIDLDRIPSDEELEEKINQLLNAPKRNTNFNQ